MENIRRYKSKLAGLKRRRRFIAWHESAAYARGLEMLLEDLRAGVKDPRTGVELLAAFFQTDAAVFEQCDDSSGSVGDVFRFEARKLFVAYASKCQDKDWLSQLVFDLTIKDDYGVRDILIDCAGQYLPESKMRELIARCQATAGKESDNYRKRQWLSRVESLARQTKDAPLFEKTRLASWGKLNSAACLDIARVHLDSGDVKTALSWLQRLPEEEMFRAHERDQLLLEIYAELGDKDNQNEVAWRTFRRHRSEKALDDLLAVIGRDQKAPVVKGEVENILEGKSLFESDAAFLIETGYPDAAQTYILERADQLNGDLYAGLLPLAKAMEAEGWRLCASVIYRALLDSILRRGRTKTYSHGVRYLKKLDRLAESISDWRGFEDHRAYLEDLRRQHGRKSSFWGRYET